MLKVSIMDPEKTSKEDEAKTQVIPAVKSKTPVIHSTLKKSLGPVRIWFILLTLLSTTGVIFASALLNPKVYAPQSTTPNMQLKQALTLALETPKDSQVITDGLLDVKGQTSPGATVVFYTETDTGSSESDSRGKFSGTIKLEKGINLLTVQAFSKDGEEKSTALNIVYDDQVKGEKTSKDEETKGTPPGQEKKQEQTTSQGQPKKEEPTQTAVIGNVEKVTSNSVVVEENKTKKEVESKVDKNTQITNQNNQNIKLNTIEPNDEAAIIREVNDKSDDKTVKTAVKIFVNQATSSAQTKRHGIQGIISNIEGNLITLVHQIQHDRQYSLYTNSQTVVKFKSERVTLASLAIGQKITAVGELNDSGKLVAKLIHIIPGGKTTIPVEEPTSTPSATPTATASAFVQTSPTPTICSETLTVPFANGTNGNTTVYEYSDCLDVTVSGIGQASGTSFSDAFYVYTDYPGNPLPAPIHYDLKYNWTLWINGASANYLIPGGVVPAYNSSHSYTFNICVPSKGKITFSVGDTYVQDNSGAYTVKTSCPK